MALTLRAVGGLSTAEIARAFGVPEATVAQRISRGKERIREAGARFCRPDEDDREERLGVVLRVLYLIFNEGYAASAGGALARVELTAEAIRLGRQLRGLCRHGEVAGLHASCCSPTPGARPDTRDGGLVPLPEQDRRRWDRPDRRRQRAGQADLPTSRRSARS